MQFLLLFTDKNCIILCVQILPQWISFAPGQYKRAWAISQTLEFLTIIIINPENIPVIPLLVHFVCLDVLISQSVIFFIM